MKPTAASKGLLRATALLEQRKREALNIYHPMPHQRVVHTTTAKRILIRGGNQSGKTLNGAIRFADCATGRTRYLDRPIKNGMKFLAASLDFTLMSDNIYKKLFEPGAFDICGLCGQVPHVCFAAGACEGEWEARAIEAPPLIPDRFMAKGGTVRENGRTIRIPRDGFAWRDKARLVPERAYLRIPAGRGEDKPLVMLDFKSTDQGRKRFQGTQWDGAWMDEEATNDESIVYEVLRGLMKRKGWFQITATPLAAGITLLLWHENAEEEERKVEQGLLEPEKQRHVSIQLLTDQNVAIAEEERESFFEGMGEEEERVRRTGEFLVQQGLVFREFDKEVHVVPPFELPWEWTIYDVLDPGHANAFAILFAAVDPHGTVWIFDELYLRRPDSLRQVVERWRAKLNMGSDWINGRPHWAERSMIDPNAGQEHAGMAHGSVRTQLFRLRREMGFKSYDGEYGIYNANNAVQPGVFAVKSLLRPRSYRDYDGQGNAITITRPRLLVFNTCHHFLREIRRYRYERPKENEDLKEQGAGKAGVVKKDDHLMDDLRYLAMGKPVYRPYEERPDYYANEKLRHALARKREKLRRQRHREITDATRC